MTDVEMIVPSGEPDEPARNAAELPAISAMSIATPIHRRARIGLLRARYLECGGVQCGIPPSPNRCRISVMSIARTDPLAALWLICKCSSVIAGHDCRAPPAIRDCQLRKENIRVPPRPRADLYVPPCPRPCDGRLRGKVHGGHSSMGHRPPAAGVRPS